MYSKTNNSIKINGRQQKTSNYGFVILILFGLVFLFIYSWLWLGQEVGFTSPDETANYHFTKLLAEENQLSFEDSLNEVTDGLIRPRSMSLYNNQTVPASFLGMILIYGSLAKLFGSSIILYLTPFFAVLGVFFFYLLIKEIFAKKVALISSLLLFVLPPFWLYAARGMFHNVLFVSLLIIGFYFLVRAIKKEQSKIKYLNFIVSGLFLGLSLITRTSEIIWIGIILLVIILFNWSKIGWRYLIGLAIPIVLVFIMVMVANNQVYGSPISFAYSREFIDPASTETVSDDILTDLRKLILPYGINFKQMGVAAYQYLLLVFPMFSVLWIVGLIWYLKKLIAPFLKRYWPKYDMGNQEMSKIEKLYLGLYVILIVWLIVYYGSYQFYEYFDRTRIILGSSYIRYWIPIYVFGLPLVVLGIFKISSLFKKALIQKLVIVFLIVFFCWLSVDKIMTDPLYGLISVKENQRNSVELGQDIFQLTETDSVIISGHADKVLFPERRVIVSLPDNKGEQKEVIDTLLTQAPVYYLHNTVDDPHQTIINSFQKNEIELVEIQDFGESHLVLYQLP